MQLLLFKVLLRGVHDNEYKMAFSISNTKKRDKVKYEQQKDELCVD